jgi:2,4-dichlorophenol 6-monooxygenase
MAADAGIPLDAVRIGHVEGDLYDPRLAWVRQRQVGPDGAVLVRPDRHIGWRSIGAAEDPRAALADALERILARRIEAPLASTGART